MKYSYIIDWLKEESAKRNDKGFVIGISGGIDSAVTSTLCAETGLPVLAVSLPIDQSPEQLKLARRHINFLAERYPNVKSIEVNLTQPFHSFVDCFPAPNEYLDANLRSRLRMAALYRLAGEYGMLVTGTGNKVEDFGVGFYTKYGDGGVDIAPIADLMKSEVREAAVELDVIYEIIQAAPTDGLWEDGRTDEDQLGASYEELEWAMTYGGDKKKLSTRQKEVIDIFWGHHMNNKHKMEPIPVCKKP